MTTERRKNTHSLATMALLAALVATKSSRAQFMEPAGETPTFKDRMREFVGLDAGKRRIQRESLVRGPDGTWCMEMAAGLQTHPAHREFAAAENAYQQGQFATAAKAFKKLGGRHKGSALEEDCLFFEAECYFQDGHLPSAVDTYHALMKDFPSTRHMTTAVQRVYKITEEWLEDSRLRSQGQSGKYNWWNRTVNLWDRRRPLLDTNGRAIEAIERIQQYDPTGPLTAPATMMAGAERFTDGDYIRAAGYYEQVVVDAPKSDLAARASVLSAQSYMRSYQGPNYDAEDLLKAKKMTEEGIKRAALLDPEQTKRLEDDLKRIHLMQAERQFNDGATYAQLRKWQGAKYCFEQVIRRFPDTPFAEKAKDELVKIAPKIPADASSNDIKYQEESTWTLPKLNVPSWMTPSLLPKKEARPDAPPSQNDEEALQLPPAASPRPQTPDSARSEATRLPTAR
jgi:outer membrane protein assembly factor BamD (BamD/ComL family)